MLATFSSKCGQGVPGAPRLLLDLCSFLFFGRPDPLLAPFGLDFGGVGARFWEVLGFILEVSGDNLGIRLLLEKLVFRSILLASGSGWAGGVTRSAKNYENFKKIKKLKFSNVILYRSLGSLGIFGGPQGPFFPPPGSEFPFFIYICY